MKLPDITAWLASERDFAQGAALYAALGASPTYKRLFALPATDYASEVLARELATLVLPATPPVPPAAEAAVSPPVPVVVLTAAPPLAEPPQALALEVQAVLSSLQHHLKAVRDERSHLHPQLTAKGLRRTERQALAGQIVALTDKEVELLVKLAHVQAHGRLPGPVATADVTDERELLRRLYTLRTRRSKLKGKPEKAEKLAAIEAEILVIQSKLIIHPKIKS